MYRKNEMKKTEAMGMVVELYKDEFMQVSIRLKAFRFHESALRKEVFYDKRDALATAYRLDHGFDDLFLEAKQIGALILRMNTEAKRDPYIGTPFLSRMYQIRNIPDPRTASDEEISVYFRDVFALLDDYEQLIYDAEQDKNEENFKRQAQ